MRVVVTGASGFVGTHLVRGLAEAYPEARVVAADRDPETPAIAAFWAPIRSQIETASLDVADRHSVNALMEKAEPTHVVHAAALTPTPEEENDDPARIVAVNVGGTLAVMDAATRRPSIRRVVTVSSGAVYGRDQSFAQAISEDTPPMPHMLYGITKVASESITVRLGELRGVSAASVRLASVYGSMERATSTRHRTSVVHRLAHAHGPMTVSAHDIVRDWVHADDVAIAVGRLLTDEPLQWNLFHIGGGEPVGWRRIVGIFQSAGRPISWASADERADIRVLAEDARPVFSIARIAAQTGFIPRSIEDGISAMIRPEKVSA
jgi:UDP-glucose 4-epimerase